MAEILGMPKLSDTMEEGVIAKWLKAVGSKVSEGDLLAAIETDKATMDYEAPTSGFLIEILAPEGTKLKLGEPICVFGAQGEKFDKSQITTSAGKKEIAGSVPVAKKLEKTSAPAPTTANSGRLVASPLAKKMASERNVDLHQLRGSGPHGRIVMRDVLEGGSLSGSSRNAIRAPLISGGSRNVPVSMMRQTIAKRLLAAKNDAPHFYLTRSIDMAQVLSWRERLNRNVKPNDPQAIKVSVNDIVMMAMSRTLKRHPECNSSWAGEHIIEFGDVHLAMAVALPSGLITPVIRHCDQLGIHEIAAKSRELAKKARDGALKPEDYGGGTFTISNLGMLGIEEFTAIINPPQAAILAVGATMKVPHVDDHGTIVVGQRMKVTLSCDHRVIDGAMGAHMLATFVEMMENPVEIFS